MESSASKTVLVTGAGRGIGRGIARAAAAAGMRVGLVARSESELAETAGLIDAAGGTACAIVADVTDFDAVARAVEAVERALGPVDGLVNNAGILGPIAPFWETPIADWRAVIDIDLAGPAICARAILPSMVARRRGRIVNVATGMIPTPHYSAYGCAKAALVRFSESLAAELRPHGVAVFALGPGTVRTAMSMRSLHSPEGKRWIPGFARIFDEELDLPMERPCDLAVALLSGRHDALSGLLVTPFDDPEMLAGRLAEIREKELYVLRLRGFPNKAVERLSAIRRTFVSPAP
ncbi:MAG TPA: SDR family oxidoreductase [Allosphingosinicella sp.]|nr:SDR family oxidoreductase [Allosphingosinicella sp.]